MNEWERLSRQAQGIKQRYPKGTKVRLGCMDGEKGMPPSYVKSTRRSLMPTISCLHKISAWGLTVTAIKGT